MKKLITVFAIIAILSCLVVILTKEETAPKTTATETVDVNVEDLTPAQLTATLTEEDDVFVYMYSPTCSFCQKAAPIIIPIVHEHDVPFKQFNIQTYGKVAVETYGVESTPTLLHFKNGKEVDRLVGLQNEETYLDFLTNP